LPCCGRFHGREGELWHKALVSKLTGGMVCVSCSWDADDRFSLEQFQFSLKQKPMLIESPSRYGSHFQWTFQSEVGMRIRFFDFP
jgi:hypothetical protein